MTRCRFCDHSIPFGADQCPNCGGPLDASARQAADDLEQQIRELLSQGQRLEAVKQYRDRAGVGLQEAREAVQAVADRAGLSAADAVDADMEAELRELLNQGRKLEAVKLYRQRTGADLLEAKRAVEALAAQQPSAGRAGGCAGMVIAILVVIAFLSSRLL
jgi:ribosomal protein L7/L12